MTRLFFFLYSWLIFAPLMVATTVILGVVCLLLVPFLPANRIAALTAVPWAKLCLYYAGIRVDVDGREHLAPGQSHVIVANHLSQFDILVLYGYLGVDFRWVMKQELRKVPMIGVCCEKLGHIFIDRANTQAAIASLDQAKAQLTQGTSVMFFPEGTRSRDGQLRPFKKGAFKMAQELALPVLPVTLTGTYEILPPDSLRLNPGRHVQITLHPALPVRDGSEAELIHLMHQSQSAIAAPLGSSCPQPIL